MPPILELRDLSTHFGGLPAVDGVDLDVERGRITALVGPNGAGKSTLLRTVSGIHAATRGQVVLDGRDVTRLPVHERRRAGVATVLQTPRPLASMTVRDNAVLGAMFGAPGGPCPEREARRAGDDALELVGLAPKASWHVRQLTLHERRTLDLARAIAGRPRVLLLDEVMAGLGPGELEESMRVVRVLRDEAGVTVLWVEHVMRAVRALAERVAVLDHGRLLAEGAPAAVMEDERVVAAYLGHRAARGWHRGHDADPDAAAGTPP